MERITLEDCRIVFRNFEGREGKYNREGDRNFAVVLPRDLAEKLLSEGWNVKFFKEREDDIEPPEGYLPVAINFKGKPPRIVLITSTGRTDLDAETVSILDWIDILHVDLLLNPYEWSVNGHSGVKAYLKSMFVTQDEDILERKYNTVSQSTEE